MHRDYKVVQSFAGAEMQLAEVHVSNARYILNLLVYNKLLRLAEIAVTVSSPLCVLVHVIETLTKSPLFHD